MNIKQELKILIIGAGEAGKMLLDEYIRRGTSLSIIGFVDDDIKKRDKMISGKPVLGTIADIGVIIHQYNVNQAIIAMPSVEKEKINSIISSIIGTNPLINIFIIPSIEKYFTSVPLAPALQDTEFSDIIDRPEVNIDIESINRAFINKTILITGAGGSIGSEICRQILKFRIKRLIAVGRGEHSIYTLIKTLNEYVEFMDDKPEVIYRIIDAKDGRLLDRAFAEYKPDIVFHAAAHKHVPLMEFNEIEAVQNNVGSTITLLDLSLKHSVNDFVLISTDKAVNPVSIMGATKRVAEIITDYYNKEKGLKTSVVRFGNVIGSRGSVVPLFREQIEKGGPVTVTHPDIVRYFMSIPEASLLVINAAAYSHGGELFVLDMGEQYRVLDIAKRLIELYGYEPDKDIKIEFSGLRPGEKMYEELYYNKESLVKTDNEKISVLKTASDSYNREIVEKFLGEDFQYVYRFSSKELKDYIKTIVPEFTCGTTGEN